MSADEPQAEPSEVAQLKAAIDDYREMLLCIWLYVPWRRVTGKLTTEQRNLWADAIEETSERWHPGDGSKVDRWWQD